MGEQTSAIVSKVWGMCNPLRDDGVSYGDYLEQPTYLIFLKMSDEYSKPPYKKKTGIPAGYTWSDMNLLKGAELEDWKSSTRLRWRNWVSKAVSLVKSSKEQPTKSAVPPFCTVWCR